MIVLYVVVPCYNEEEVIHETAKRLQAKLKSLVAMQIVDEKSKIVFVNDGSKDRTWEIIMELHQENVIFSGINLSRNCGHQAALLAGLMTVKDYADCIISLDADLQDDINAIDLMIQSYMAGNEIVYGVRSKREKDSFFKKFTAESFYKILSFLGGQVVFNHADYRLMSRRALNYLEEFNEVNLFLRGIVPMLGLKSSIVEYERNERFAGESKYPLKKMLSFALEGITSLSNKPLKLITKLGISIFLFSLVMFIYILISYFYGSSVAGWASVAVSVWGIGGLILFSLGIIGEYIGKIYLEVKHRPKYFVESIMHSPKDID